MATRSIGKMISKIFPKKTVGLCLSGGGIRGFAHLGVLKAFEEEGFTFDCISGTSVGALIGSAYALGYKSDEIMEYGKTLNLRSFLHFQDVEESAVGKERFIKTAVNEIKNFKITLSTNKLEDICRDFYDDKKFSDTLVPFCCVASDIKNGREVVFEKGSLSFAAACSSALPGVFTPVCTKEAILVDGYVFNNLPADILKKRGADYVVSVDLKPMSAYAQCANAGYFETIFSVIDLMSRQTGSKGVYNSDIIITPDIKKYEKISFNETIITGLYEAGYSRAKQEMFRLRELFSSL